MQAQVQQASEESELKGLSVPQQVPVQVKVQAAEVQPQEAAAGEQQREAVQLLLAVLLAVWEQPLQAVLPAEQVSVLAAVQALTEAPCSRC